MKDAFLKSHRKNIEKRAYRLWEERGRRRHDTGSKDRLPVCLSYLLLRMVHVLTFDVTCI